MTKKQEIQKPTNLVSVRFNDADLKRLKKLAYELDCPLSAAIRDAVLGLIKEREKNDKRN